MEFIFSNLFETLSLLGFCIFTVVVPRIVHKAGKHVMPGELSEASRQKVEWLITISVWAIVGAVLFAVVTEKNYIDFKGSMLQGVSAGAAGVGPTTPDAESEAKILNIVSSKNEEGVRIETALNELRLGIRSNLDLVSQWTNKQFAQNVEGAREAYVHYAAPDYWADDREFTKRTAALLRSVDALDSEIMALPPDDVATWPSIDPAHSLRNTIEQNITALQTYLSDWRKDARRD